MTQKFYRMLRLKIVAMTLCFSLVPLFAVGITIYYQFSEAYKTKIMEGLRTLAQNRAGAVELFLDETDRPTDHCGSHSLFGSLERRVISQ